MPASSSSRGGPWYGEFKRRLAFERGAKAEFPGLKTSLGRSSGYSATVMVDLPGYERRELRISFDRAHVRAPRILVDGPERSPHRFEDGSLCIWYPRDPDENRWVVSDGLVVLIGYSIEHLFREAWWRETGEWLGDEAPHGGPGPKPLQREEDSDGHHSD